MLNRRPLHSIYGKIIGHVTSEKLQVKKVKNILVLWTHFWPHGPPWMGLTLLLTDSNKQRMTLQNNQDTWVKLAGQGWGERHINWRMNREEYISVIINLIKEINYTNLKQSFYQALFFNKELLKPEFPFLFL